MTTAKMRRCGYPDGEAAKTVAGNLSLNTQANILAAILRLGYRGALALSWRN
jgi:hypothetical protein